VFFFQIFSGILGAAVSVTRDYGYDETAVLAKEHEEQSLRAALADEIASLILRRLTALEP
jgi:outer membrane lipopolysaccharide assembly protein LptE/RlpB